MRIWLGVCCALLLLTLPAYADYDENGNLSGTSGGEVPGDSPGDICGQCPDPNGLSRGVAYKNGDLWVLLAPTLYHLSNCTLIETVTLQGGSGEYGLGYDSTRDLWITSDAGSDMISTWNPDGTLVATWPSPGGPDRGPVGVAYDSIRDLYWFSDWVLDRIVSANPDGTPGPLSFAAFDGRVAGTAYDPGTDILYYNGRDSGYGYCVSASTGGLIVSFPIPLAGGNNGQGAGIAPDGNVWITHFEQPTIYCLEKNGGTTPVESSTWGAIKALF